jgi:hypothetical protein
MKVLRNIRHPLIIGFRYGSMLSFCDEIILLPARARGISFLEMNNLKKREFYHQQLRKQENDAKLLFNKVTTCLASQQHQETVRCLNKSALNASIE